MTNRISKVESSSTQSERPVTFEQLKKNALVEKARRLIAPILAISSLTSTATAQTIAPTSAPVENKQAAPSKFTGVASVGIQYVATGYRKGSNLRLQLNAPKVGPVTPSVTAQLNSASTTGLWPALSANASMSLPIVSRKENQPAYLAVNPVFSAGVQFGMAGLDSEKTTDYLVLPYYSATLNVPLFATLDPATKSYFTFTPSANYFRYIRTSDYGLKVDDKNADGKPDFMRPKQQLYFGVTTGITFDNNKSFINTSVYHDPFDPSLEKSNGKSIFGYLNIGRNF